MGAGREIDGWLGEIEEELARLGRPVPGDLAGWLIEVLQWGVYGLALTQEQFTERGLSVPMVLAMQYVTWEGLIGTLKHHVAEKEQHDAC